MSELQLRAQSPQVVAALFVVMLAGCAPKPPAPPPSYTGPIIDTHAHIRLGASDALLPSQPQGTDTLQKLDDAAGVVRSALIVIARKGQLDKTRAQNDAVINTAARAATRFYPVGSVHPHDGADALTELDRLSKLGVKIIKLHPNTQDFDVADPAVAAVAQKCGALGLVLLFDSYKPWDANEMGKLLMLSLQQPRTRFVLAHMGFSGFRQAISFAMVRKLEMGGNVWFDLSAIANTYADSPVEPELLWTLRQVGTEFILFGSDWPVYAPADAVAAVRRLGLTAEEQRRVFHDNAAELLGL